MGQVYHLHDLLELLCRTERLLFCQFAISPSKNAHCSCIVCVRFSPTGSVVVMAERPRAKSESPGRVDDQRHPSSQVH